eukprot:Nk52_evm69s224 gene=Nk52_evmTU69s224
MAGDESNKPPADAPGEEDSDDELQELDMSLSDRSLWLVKIPTHLSKAWAELEEGATLGDMYIKQSSNPEQPDIKIVADVGDKKIPKNYSLAFAKAVQQPRMGQGSTSVAASSNTMALFSEVPSTKEVALEGVVTQRGDMKPEFSDEYRMLNRERTLAATKPKRVLQSMDDDGGIKYTPMRALSSMITHKPNNAKDTRKKEIDKRERMDKEQLRDLLFKLFEKQQSYLLKELLTHTKQPVAFLKELLREIGTYNTKGPHKSKWMLKEEYRHYNEEEQGAGEGGEPSEELL